MQCWKPCHVGLYTILFLNNILYNICNNRLQSFFSNTIEEIYKTLYLMQASNIWFGSSPLPTVSEMFANGIDSRSIKARLDILNAHYFSPNNHLSILFNTSEMHWNNNNPLANPHIPLCLWRSNQDISPRFKMKYPLQHFFFRSLFVQVPIKKALSQNKLNKMTPLVAPKSESLSMWILKHFKSC